jgi:broad specificity phosphatase PhoE
MRSAGSRDSALTNHGYQQATRLGKHFSSLGLSFTQIFSSHLQRAVKTASVIREAQVASTRADDARVIPDVQKLPVLVEQDFGYLEGKKWGERSTAAKDMLGLADVESKDSLAVRADSFLDKHLFPLICEGSEPTNGNILIVSHGVFLSTLWKRLLLRLHTKSVSLSPELQKTARPSLEHLGGWSNTGYLELHLTQSMITDVYPVRRPSTIPPPGSAPSRPDLATGEGGAEKQQLPPTTINDAPTSGQAKGVPTKKIMPVFTGNMKQCEHHQTTIKAIIAPSHSLRGWTMVIMKVNAKDHLIGLKRTGGGVGSSRHDNSQKVIDAFFKRRKLE